MLHILDLPAELWLLILEHSTTDSIFRLSTACRHLNEQAIPIFLQRHQISDPSTHCKLYLRGSTVTPKIDALSGLQMAWGLRSLDHLECVFAHCNRTNFQRTTDAVIHDLTRLNRLMTRLSSLKRVVLRFEADFYYHGKFEALQLHRWVTMFGHFLNIAISKVKSFEVRGTTFFSFPYDDLLPNGDSSGFQTTKWTRVLPNVLQSVFGNANSRKNNYPHISLAPEVNHLAPIEELIVKSDILVRPPCLHWLLEVLRHCRIKSLTLHITNTAGALWSQNTTEIWSRILGYIGNTDSKITELHLLDARTNPNEFIDFVRKFSQLSTLTMTNYLPTCSPRPDLAPPRLPQLTRLRAPVEFLELLLASPSSFPNLEELEIRTQHEFSVSLNIHAIANILKLVHGRSVQGLASPTISLWIEYYHNPKNAMFRDLQGSLWKEDTSLPTSITHLKISIAHIGLQSCESYFERVGPWAISLFPTLETLTILDHGLRRRERAIMLKSVWNNHPHIYTITVNQQRYSRQQGHQLWMVEAN